MGICINRKYRDNNEFLTCCNNSTLEPTKTEVVSARDHIKYYLSNQINEFTVDYNKKTIIDKSDNLSVNEIKLPPNYFRLLDIYSNNLFSILLKFFIIIFLKKFFQ